MGKEKYLLIYCYSEYVRELSWTKFLFHRSDVHLYILSRWFIATEKIGQVLDSLSWKKEVS